MVEQSRAGFLALLYLACLIVQTVRSNPVNIPVNRVPLTLWEKAWKALNEHSPTHHQYAQGELINAQELEEPPYKVYKFTYNLNPMCGTESCPREACTIDLKQDERGDIETMNDSIQCMYYYPADTQNDMSLEQQSYQEQDDSQVTQENTAEQAINNRSVELDHEVQETNEGNEKMFIALRASGNNYCPGCPYELNPNQPSLIVFGAQAVRSMDELTSSDYKHKLISILRVTRTVPVSSTNLIQYQVLVQIGESECSKNSLEQEQECPLRATAPQSLCLVTFEQQFWRRESLRIIRNNCTDSESTVSSSYQPQLDLESQSQVTVKYNHNEQPPRTETDAYEGLKDMLDSYTYMSSTPSKEPEEAAVTEPTITKVVLNRSEDEKIAGFTDKATEFNEFLKDFDLPIKLEEVTPDTREPVKEEKFLRKKVLRPDCQIGKTTFNQGDVTRRKRSTRQTLVGGVSSTSVDDPEIQEFTRKALRKFSQESNSSNEPFLVNITEASVQIVSGTLYKIKVKLGTSNCPKGTSDNCQLLTESEVKECLITVWSQPWLDHGSPSITVQCPPPAEALRRQERSLRGVNYNQKMLRIAEDLRTEKLFVDFMTTYNRTYATSEERSLRLQIFRDNLQIIRLLRKNEQGTGRYGINMFADVSREEFRARYLGLRLDLHSENNIPLRQAKIPDIDLLPPSYDWRQKGVVTPVKDQGMCGSCWAFSVTGNVEGQYAIKHGQLLSLSEQELLDCDDLDEGCNGGLPENAYRAIEKLGGLELESDYPYDAEDEKCHFRKNLAKVQLTSAVNVTSNETQMAQWLVENGPISIGINANAMQFYVGGVSHPLKFLCNPKNLDHGVLIVGYGTSKYPLFHRKLPYWIIKNSWGKRWGEQGYYRVYRGDGTCGLNTMATSAVVV